MNRSEDKDKVRVAIVGFDHVHVLRYLPTLAEHHRVELVGIIDLTGDNHETAREFAERYELKLYDDLYNGLDKLVPEAVYIATSPDLHLKVISELVRREIHILCDKPVAVRWRDAIEIHKLVKSSNVKFMMPFNPRFQKPFIKLKELIDNGELGELVSLYAVKVGKNPLTIKGFNTHWFAESKRAGFGGFGDIGIHAIYAILWITGMKPVEVRATISNEVHKLEVDDFGFANITLYDERSGRRILASLLSGWFNPVGYPTWLDVRMEVLGERGFFIIDKPYHDYWIYTDKAVRENWWRVDINDLVNEFIVSILQDRQPAITIDDALETFKLVLACYKSASEGEVVKLESFNPDNG